MKRTACDAAFVGLASLVLAGATIIHGYRRVRRTTTMVKS